MTTIGRLVRTFALLAGVLVTCTACATDFKAADAARIKTIAFAPIEEPTYNAMTQFVLRTFSTDRDNRDSFAALMAKQNLLLGAELKAAIAKELRSVGYNMIEDGDTATADAIFKIEFTGFPPATTPAYSAAVTGFEPEFIAMINLKDAKSKRTLFDRLYVYRDNMIAPVDGSLLIKPDQKYNIPSATELYGNPQLAAEGFRAGVQLIAKSVAESLKK